MSFILDALRKSENERQRQAGPGIAELPVARVASRAPVILIAVGALLAVNLVVVLYWLLKDDAPQVVREEAVAAQPSATAATPTPTPAQDDARPAPVAVATLPAQDDGRPAPVTSREVRPLAAEVTAGPPPDAAPPPAPDPSLLPTAPLPTQAYGWPPRQQATGSGYAPRIDTLPPQATAGLPELNLDLHIYSTDPAQRAAFINGARYRAGDQLPQGVDVVDITHEGVVLRYRDQQFLLPRQ
jgi:general secretion pathway protein B